MFSIVSFLAQLQDYDRTLKDGSALPILFGPLAKANHAAAAATLDAIAETVAASIRYSYCGRSAGGLQSEGGRVRRKWPLTWVAGPGFEPG